MTSLLTQKPNKGSIAPLDGLIFKQIAKDVFAKVYAGFIEEDSIQRTYGGRLKLEALSSSLNNKPCIVHETRDDRRKRDIYSIYEASR